MRVLRVHGLCRSGNHAVIGWLVHKFDGGVVHKNNIIFNPKKKMFRPTEQPRRYKKAKPVEAQITSFEDYDIEKYFGEYEKHLPDIPHTNVFIVRDPFNLFASREKKAQEANHRRLKVDQNVVRLWKLACREAFGETNLTNNKVVVNFNDWVTSREYRDNVSLELNLSVDNDNVGVMSKDGNGSSFDKFKYRNNPQEMKLLERWKHFENNAAFLALFDEELIEMSDTYFGIRGDK